MDVTWRELIDKAFIEANDAPFNSESRWCFTIKHPTDLDKSFDPGYGGPEGSSFTAWGHNFVYFPVCYDGSEWVGFVSRHPNNTPTDHLGGG